MLEKKLLKNTSIHSIVENNYLPVKPFQWVNYFFHNLSTQNLLSIGLVDNKHSAMKRSFNKYLLFDRMLWNVYDSDTIPYHSTRQQTDKVR